MPSSTIGISGYDLVRSVISARQDDAIFTLIANAGGSECDYLELKASIMVKDKDLKDGEKPTDIYWNIARELIGMVNTRGGILVIGIDDTPDHNVVPLRESDPDGIIEHEGMEAYMRKAVDSRVLPDNQEWVYKHHQTRFSIHPERFDSMKWMKNCRLIRLLQSADEGTGKLEHAFHHAPNAFRHPPDT